LLSSQAAAHPMLQLVLSNEGRVPFDFGVDLSRLSRPGVVEASPLKGAIAGGEKQVRGREED
jgi:hydrocephalus-inducing protein